MALFWLLTSYHAQRYMLRSLVMQSFNIVNAPIILLFSKKWVPGFAAEDNNYAYMLLGQYFHACIYSIAGTNVSINFVHPILQACNT